MKIECKLKRQGGSLVTLGDQKYHFAPDQLDRHVAEVTDEAHIARFLEIPQYREIRDDGDAQVAATTSGETLTPTGEGDKEKDEEPATKEKEKAVDLEALDDEGLRAAYEEVIGKKPHAKAKRETLIKHINEAAEA